MWKDHFENLYNSGADSKFRNIFYEKVRMTSLAAEDLPSLSLHDIVDAISRQKRDKAAGPDGVHMEDFIFSGPRLKFYLSVLFNLFLAHGYVPENFCQSTIIPLVKCKSGDLSDLASVGP